VLTCYSESQLNLIPINKGSNGPLDYSFDIEKSIYFPGAHSEEIVRDSFTDVHVGIFHSLRLDLLQLTTFIERHHIHMR
jgi:hypothetical protein